MGLISRAIGINALSAEDPSQPLLPPSALYESLGLGNSDAGILINERQSMRLVVVFGCIKVISEDLGRLPLEIFQTLPDGSLRLATTHRLWSILHDRPNPQMSSMVWRGAMLASANAYGNAYSWIKRDKAARVTALVPLDSSRTSPVYRDGEFLYATTQTTTGAAVFIDPANMLHIMGPSLDGIVGMSPIQTCKNAMGLSVAAERYGAQFFANGARATGVLSHPGVLGTEALANLKKSLREAATGENALRPMILEEGMKWDQITIPPEEAQFILTRKFQKEEIACLFRVPMHLLQDLQRSTNNNIEHQGLDYVRFCLAPWAVRIEQEINHKLLSGPYTAEHNLNDLQRGDFATQTTGFQTLRNIGVYSTNNILKAMRQNPISAEEGGDVLTIQGAMISLAVLVSNPDGTAPSGPDIDEANPDTDQGDPAASLRHSQIVAAYRPLIRDAVGRAINRTGDAEFCAKALRPAISSMRQALLASRFGNGTLTKSDLDLIGRQAKDIAAGAAAWQKQDAAVIATRITEQLYGALATEIIQ